MSLTLYVNYARIEKKFQQQHKKKSLAPNRNGGLGKALQAWKANLNLEHISIP